LTSLESVIAQIGNIAAKHGISAAEIAVIKHLYAAPPEDLDGRNIVAKIPQQIGEPIAERTQNLLPRKFAAVQKQAPWPGMVDCSRNYPSCFGQDRKTTDWAAAVQGDSVPRGRFR
jgi:hypothetical protein